MNLINGAQPCNVFWQVGSSATLGTSSVFVGNIMALTSVSLNNAVTVQGRVLARNGSVTLINDTISAGRCAPGTTGSGTGPGEGSGDGSGSGASLARPGNGSAVFTTVSRSVATTVARYGTSRCVDRSFRAVVTGLLIRRVVFSVGTHVIATRSRSPFEALVKDGSGIRTVTARGHLHRRDARQDAEDALQGMRSGSEPRRAAQAADAEHSDRLHRMRRLLGALVGCLLIVPAGAQAAPAMAGPRIAAHQETVALLGSAVVRSGPAADANVVAHVAAHRPMTGARTVLPLLGQSIDATGGSWLQVRLPGRALKGSQPPASGWIGAAKTRMSATDWHLVVNLRARSVSVYRNGQKLRSYKAIVGKTSTPTPRGEFFVEENVRLPGNRPGAPFALATSARSKVFQEFEGGPGQIALHGLVQCRRVPGHGRIARLRPPGQPLDRVARRPHQAR